MSQIIALFSNINNKQFIFLAILLLLVVDVIYFLWHFLREKFFTKKGIKTTAQVVQAVIIEDENSSYQEITLIYRDETGLEYSTVFENKFKPFHVGEMVGIFYNKKNPSDIMINNWRTLYFNLIVSFLIGCALIFTMRYVLLNGIAEVVKFW